MSFSDLPNGSDGAIKPFKIETPKKVLDELKTLVQYSKIAVPTFENSQKDGKYGLSREWLESVKAKWADFDWSKTEDRLNSFPHFLANVKDDDGTKYDVHFAALFSKKADAVPLMMVHGWPGSFLEFMPIFQLLKDKYTPETLPYHVIVPSLPGYTLSSGPTLERDFGIEDASRILDRVMSMLGFGGGYVVQGGDIGSRVGRFLAFSYPNCKAVHVNFLLTPKPANASEEDLTETEKKGIARGVEFRETGVAYALEHATRPSTIGLVLSSSPMALMAWIGEKFFQWSDATPSDETIIEFATLYWITDTIPRCLYPYRQDLPAGTGSLKYYITDIPASDKSFGPGGPKPAMGYIEKPMGFSSFPKELATTPRAWAETQGNLVFHRVHDKGGHFAALERPEVLLKDVEDFIAQVWGKQTLPLRGKE